MKFEILTIFPDFFRGPLDYGIVRKARQAGLVEVGIHDLREFTHDRHRTVDDRPFGGGEGMVLKPEPIFECLEALDVRRASSGCGTRGEAVMLLSPQGRLFSQAMAQELVARERVVLICGRYEGVDERVAEFLADGEVSVGDFVLSGGELGAAIVIDTTTRLLPGALGNAASAKQESFTETAAETSARVAGEPPEFDVRFGRIAGLSALYASGGVSRDAGSRGAGEWRPRSDSQVASPAGTAEDVAATARPAAG